LERSEKKFDGSSVFGVKTSTSKENSEPANKMQLSRTNFQDLKYYVSEPFGQQLRMNNF